MENKKLLKNVFNSLSRAIDKLSEDEILDVESGNFEINFLFSGKRSVAKKDRDKASLDESVLNRVNNLLNKASTREEGVLILEEHLKGRAELESFAKSIDVPVMKSDKVITIKEKIVDSTVGARLRSGAILGKKI
jgi:hypothetical protein